MQIHDKVQIILDRYDSTLQRSLSLFSNSRSPSMINVANWVVEKLPLGLLRQTLLSAYQFYLNHHNFQKGTSKKGIDSTMEALFQIDIEVFEGRVFADHIKRNTTRDRVSGLVFLERVWQTLSCRLAKAGLWHFIPEEMIRQIEPIEFSIQDEWGNTPIMWSIANGNMTDAAFLATRVPIASLKVADKQGKIPLHFMAVKGSTYQASWYDHFYYTGFNDGSIRAVFDAMLSREDIDESILNAQDKKGNTALHLAYARRDKHMVDRLIEKGASQTIKNRLGYTPYQLYLKYTSREAKIYLSSYVQPSMMSDVPSVTLENRLDETLNKITVSV